MRRRLERMPERLVRVGERAAGADSGDDLMASMRSLAAGDVGCRVRRGVEAGLGGVSS